MVAVDKRSQRTVLVLIPYWGEHCFIVNNPETDEWFDGTGWSEKRTWAALVPTNQLKTKFPAEQFRLTKKI